MKKKISILTISLGTGGTERVISLLLKPLIKDFHVTLILLYNKVDFEIPQEVNLQILGHSDIHKNKSSLKKIVNTLLFIYKYYKIAKKENFEATLSFLALPNFINSSIGLLSKKSKTLKIISERCYPSKMYKNNALSMKIAKTLYPFFYNSVDIIFSNSVHINQDLKTNFGIKITTKVIYNPIEVNEYNRFKHNYNSNSSFKLINVGSLSPVKNQKLILKAIIKLESDVELTILGAGILSKDLNIFIQDHDIKNKVRMPGNVRNIIDYLLKSDCFILSSNTEGFPNALIEAMAAGVPVIATNCLSGPLEILNDNISIQIEQGEFYLAKYGILINVNDDVALSKAIEFYKKNQDIRKKYSDLGYLKSKEYDLPIIYKQIKSLIDSK